VSSPSTDELVSLVPAANLIGGRWQEVDGSADLPVIDPATEVAIARIPDSSSADVDRAVGAARAALPSWATLTPRQRSERLMALADALEEDLRTMSDLETLDAGHPTGVVSGEITSGADRPRFYAGAGRTLEGRAAGEYAPGYTSMIRREPIGVAGLITPWNYPILTAITKVAPALAAGNTVVLKPSEQTPLTALRFAALAHEILPAGVLNVVNGRGSTAGAALVTHPDVDIVSLTGGTVTGREVSRLAADSLKRVLLELGGKAPAIVLDDADAAATASALRYSAFWNAGQDCSAATRVIVTPGIYDELLDQLARQVASIAVGDPQDPTTDMGPLTYDAHRDRVVGFIERAVDEGGTVHIGGGRRSGAGYFLEPTIITGVAQGSAIVQSEVFGPVITLQRVPDLDEAVAAANDVEYGLGASVFTHDIGNAMEASRRLDFGTVWINDHGAVSAEMPWGGFKQSGHAKERSIYALEEYTRIKHVMVKLP